MEPLKIIGLAAENVQRITAVDLKFDGNFQVIGGDNKQGKTSVMHAIWLTIGGAQATKEVNAPSPIRDGETEASATVDMGEFLAKRRWWYDIHGAIKSELKLENKEGLGYKSPQKLMDTFTSMIGIDPVMFSQLPPAKQTAVLLDLVQLDIDPVALDLQYADVFAKRTAENARVKEFTERLKGYPQPPADLPTDFVSSADLFAAIEAGQELVKDTQRARLNAQQATERAALTERQLAELTAQLANERVEADRLAAVAEAMESVQVPDLEKLRADMANVDTLNMQVKAEQDRQNGLRALAAVKASADNMTAKLDEIKATKAAGLARAVWPVEGLGFGADGLTFNDLPFSQVSSAEMIEISLAMGKALNPRLRTVIIRDGSLLDNASMTRTMEWAQRNNFQVIVERVGNHDAGAIIMQDGAAL